MPINTYYMQCLVTNRIAQNATDIQTKINMLTRQRMFSSDMRERINLSMEIGELKAIIILDNEGIKKQAVQIN